MSFKRKFMYIAQKCLRPPAVIGNRELVELFVKTLDSVRATRVELQEIPQLIIIMKYGYNLPPGDSSEN